MMEQLKSVSILGLVFLSLIFVKDASSVNIDIDPNNPTETLDTSVHFSCTPGQDTNKYKEIYVMDIIKDNKKQIAVLTSSGITFKHDDVEKRYEARGVLNSMDVTQTYLNLTLLLPRIEDSGYYACVISYLDADGILQQDKHSSRLVVKKIDGSNEDYLKIIVNSLVRRVEALEIADEQNEMEKKDLRDRIKDQDNVLKRLDALERKSNYVSVFSATIKEKNARVTLAPSEVIVFDDVLQKQGLGYDKNSGVFTAKKKGIYSFHLVMGTWSLNQTFTDVDLVVNGLSKARLQNTYNNKNTFGSQDQSEVSLVVVLKVGDKVKAVTSSETTSDEQMIGDLCMFSGYLVRALA